MMPLKLSSRHLAAAAALFTLFALPNLADANGRFHRADDCEECEDCDTTCSRPPFGYGFCRMVKLHSVYAWRKCTRPYRPMAEIPPQLAPHVAPSLPPNPYTHPFGGVYPAVGYGAPGASPVYHSTSYYNGGSGAGSYGPAVNHH
ncbi:MAG: hypothetical protein EHM42_10140 [Planctomycetaceae bacterium]|nr:MAG: hypothetical protein EHM42_10140 [Planctomycetaceae bacterium]